MSLFYAASKRTHASLPVRSLSCHVCARRVCAMHSIRILDPLLNDTMRSHPAWASWVKHVELFSLVIQHELHVSDIEKIDNLQLAHSAAFDAVPEYVGLKRPKHHFCAHVPRDAWHFGPPRGYWCFGFEAFNKVIKQGARRSNWKNVTKSIMEYWSMRSARRIVRPRAQSN